MFSVESLEARQMMAGDGSVTPYNGGQTQTVNPAVASLPWGFYPTLLGQDQIVAKYPWLDGTGQGVALVDRGVDYLHPALGGGIGPDFVIKGGYNFVDNNDDPMDVDGHGTGVAGLLGALPWGLKGYKYQGMVPDANFYALRQNDGYTIKAALDWVIANRVKYNIVAINLTDFIGSGHAPNVYNFELQVLHDAGVFIATPVGNEGAEDLPIGNPAADPNVFGGGGIGKDGQITAQTQRGPGLDILGPGADVAEPFFYPPGSSPPAGVPYGPVFVDYALGTSWSAPHMTAGAVYLKQIDPTITPDEILQIEKDSGVPTVDPVHDVVYPRISLISLVELGYKRRDDAFQGNTSFARAEPLAFRGSQITASNLKLLIGKDDYYSFTVAKSGNVTLGVQYGGPSAFPEVELIDADKHLVNTVGPNGLTLRLAAGDYVVHLHSDASLSGAYGLQINTAVAAPPAGPAVAGTYNDSAYDSNGTLDFAWYDRNDGALKFESRTDGLWSSPTTIDGSVGSGYAGLSVAIDGGNLPGVAYYDSAGGQLKYAHFDGTNWVVSTADDGGTSANVGFGASLAYDAKGHPGITYYDRTNGDLKFAFNSSGRWSVSTIESAGDVGRSNSVAYNAATGWGVAYSDVRNRTVKYASLSRRGWAPATVARGNVGLGDISLAFDKKNLPAFSFYDAAAGDLYFARYNGRRWNSGAVVATRADTGMYNDLAFADDGSAIILAYNGTADQVFSERGDLGRFAYAVQSTTGGRYLSVAAGPGGRKSYSWLDDNGSALRVNDF